MYMNVMLQAQTCMSESGINFRLANGHCHPFEGSCRVEDSRPGDNRPSFQIQSYDKDYTPRQALTKNSSVIDQRCTLPSEWLKLSWGKTLSIKDRRSNASISSAEICRAWWKWKLGTELGNSNGKVQLSNYLLIFDDGPKPIHMRCNSGRCKYVPVSLVSIFIQPMLIAIPWKSPVEWRLVVLVTITSHSKASIKTRLEVLLSPTHSTQGLTILRMALGYFS